MVGTDQGLPRGLGHWRRIQLREDIIVSFRPPEISRNLQTNHAIWQNRGWMLLWDSLKGQVREAEVNLALSSGARDYEHRDASHGLFGLGVRLNY